MQTDSILLTEMDFFRLNSLIETRNTDPYSHTEIQNLSEELNRALLVDFPEVPPDLVTMNSRIQYLNFEDNMTAEITIVYPHQADHEKGRISVTAPLGAALIGLREYDEIVWTFPDGKKKRLKVLDIIYQPEQNGDLHL